MTTDPGAEGREAVIGFLVVLREEHGRWTDTWDGEVWPDEETGKRALEEAAGDGWEARLCQLTPVSRHRNSGSGNRRQPTTVDLTAERDRYRKESEAKDAVVKAARQLVLFVEGAKDPSAGEACGELGRPIVEPGCVAIGDDMQISEMVYPAGWNRLTAALAALTPPTESEKP